MSINPLISIIIPTFNRVHIVSETLDSVIAQTYGNWECIIVDDGSTDETERLIGAYCEKDSRFQYHHRPENRSKGANACRNYGFELSKGEYVLFLDSDDLLKDTCLELRLDTFKKDDNLDFVIGNTSFYKNAVLRVFNAKIIFEYAIPYFYQNKKTANSLFLSLMNSKMYNPMQRLNFGILFFLLNTGLFKIKGIGIYRFTSYLSHNLLSK